MGTTLRAKLHYLALMLLMPIYGSRVCQFIEAQGPFEALITIDWLLVAAWLARAPLYAVFVERAPLLTQTRRVFVLELGLLTTVALSLALFNTVINDFTLGSGLKVLVGITAMGFFAAADLALERERSVAAAVERDGQQLTPSANFLPLAVKMAAFATIGVALFVGVFALLINKDIHWLVQASAGFDPAAAERAVLEEFAFVLLIALPEVINIILSFSRNLDLFLKRENQALERIAADSYDATVPVSTNDEFGVMAFRTNEMVRGIRERTNELSHTRDVTILTLASLAETRDNETGAHILRTQRYVKALAEQLRTHPRFAAALDDKTIDLLYKSAPLHDIGKVGIPDAILLKPGKLTDEEFAIMKRHTQIGADALAIAEKALGANSFLRIAREIALTHHEKWDGSGYPVGLRGDAIPISGRLMAVADVYDALISKRVYKPAFSHEKAMTIIREGRGRHFDPDVVDAMNAIESTFQQIAADFRDESGEHLADEAENAPAPATALVMA